MTTETFGGRSRSQVFCRNGGEILLVRHKRLDLWLSVGGEIEPGPA